MVGSAAASEEAALRLADLHVGGHLLEVLGVHQCTDLGLGVVRVADHDGPRPRGVLLAELLVHGTLHEDAGSGGAALPIEGEHPEQGRIDRGIDVGVREHDAGRLPSELHRESLEVGRGVPEDRLTRGGLAREGDQGHVGVLHEGVPGFGGTGTFS